MRGLPGLAVAVALCSCHVIFPYEPLDVDQGLMDTAAGDPDTAPDLKTPDTAQDVGAPDTAQDVGAPDTAQDVGAPDTAQDVGIPDTAPDLKTPDTTQDVGAPDTTQDVGAPDTAPDVGAPPPDAQLLDAPPVDQPVPPPDQGADAPSVDVGSVSPIPCAAGIQKGTKWSPGPMQACLAAGPINQCSAEALCNVAGGWHLCTASEYLSRGGITGGSADHAWLKSCVRSNGKNPTFPTDSLCAACNASGSVSNEAEVGWYCITGVVQYTLPHDNVGVRTNYDCKRVGQNSPDTEAFWAPLTSGSNVAVAAVCCAP